MYEVKKHRTDAGTESTVKLGPEEYNFRTLLSWGQFISFIGWLSVASGIVVVIIGFGFRSMLGLPAVLGGLGTIVGGLIFVASGQLFSCFVAIERNTRSTYEAVARSMAGAVRSGFGDSAPSPATRGEETADMAPAASCLYCGHLSGGDSEAYAGKSSGRICLRHEEDLKLTKICSVCGKKVGFLDVQRSMRFVHGNKLIFLAVHEACVVSFAEKVEAGDVEAFVEKHASF